MATRSKFVSLGVIVSVLLVAGTALRADNGSVSGQLTDPQGKPVADATVSVVQDRDSQTAQTRTDANGRFAFYSLRLGVYKLVGVAPGFVDVSQTVKIGD